MIIENDSISLIANINRLHTTEMGVDRIRRNLDLNASDIVEWCKIKILDKNCDISRKGKNWYAVIDNYVITVNDCSYTIITAHKQNDR